MAFYEYQCKSCEHIFTKSLSISNRKEPETQPCPECGAYNVLQYIGAPLIHSGEGITQEGKPHPEFKELLNKIGAKANRKSSFSHE
jgi:putative FmdB family regulatory protein